MDFWGHSEGEKKKKKKLILLQRMDILCKIYAYGNVLSLVLCKPHRSEWVKKTQEWDRGCR